MDKPCSVVKWFRTELKKSQYFLTQNKKSIAAIKGSFTRTVRDKFSKTSEFFKILNATTERFHNQDKQLAVNVNEP